MDNKLSILPNDIKYVIASFDINVWLKLYMIDDDFRLFTLGNNMFCNIFRKHVIWHKIKARDLIVLDDKLCRIKYLFYSKSINTTRRGVGISTITYVTNEKYEAVKRDKIFTVFR